MAAYVAAFLLLCPLVAASQSDAPAADATPSQLLRPGLDLLGRDLPVLQVERWKLNSALRSQSVSDLQSIQRDLDTTLPPLLAAADAAPRSVSALLPVSRNVTALYDVLLRLVERGRSAPADQQGTLEQARAGLDSARRSFDEALQTSATAQETRIKLLQAPPPPPPPPPPAPVVKKKKRPTS